MVHSTYVVPELKARVDLMIIPWHLELVVSGEELPNISSPWQVVTALTLSSRGHQIPFPVY